MATQVLSRTLTNRLQAFFEGNKDAVVIHAEEEEQKLTETIGEPEQAAGSSSFVERNEGNKEEEEELKPLNASSKDLSYRLCGNRVRRNFLRHYLMSVKGKKERVYLNDDGLMVSSMPYMKGTIDTELNLNGYFETYLVGRDAKTKLPFSFSLGDGGDKWADANMNNGRINGFPKDKSSFDMPISSHHAVYWFKKGNKHRRLANIPLFQTQMLRWRDVLVEQRAAHKQKRLERKREIDEMIAQAHQLGYVRKNE